MAISAFKKHAVASTGKKTLTYSDPVRHFSTTYDYSENKAIQEITNIFSGFPTPLSMGASWCTCIALTNWVWKTS